MPCPQNASVRSSPAVRRPLCALHIVLTMISPAFAAPAATVTGSAAVPQKMIKLHSADAGCLDGSPYAFYIIPGSTAEFTIGIHGGGWCYTEEDCLERASTELGSSKNWNLTECFHPPAFSCFGLGDNCTRVFMPYCDGSSFTSHRDDRWPVPNSSDTLLFRGKMNLERTLGPSANNCTPAAVELTSGAGCPRAR